AKRRGHIGALDDDRLGSQFVECWRVNLYSSVAGHGIGSLLIREKYEQVRRAHRFFRLIKHSSSGSLASKSIRTLGPSGNNDPARGPRSSTCCSRYLEHLRAKSECTKTTQDVARGFSTCQLLRPDSVSSE